MQNCPDSNLHLKIRLLCRKVCRCLSWEQALFFWGGRGRCRERRRLQVGWPLFFNAQSFLLSLSYLSTSSHTEKKKYFFILGGWGGESKGSKAEIAALTWGGESDIGIFSFSCFRSKLIYLHGISKITFFFFWKCFLAGCASWNWQQQVSSPGICKKYYH